ARSTNAASSGPPATSSRTAPRYRAGTRIMRTSSRRREGQVALTSLSPQPHMSSRRRPGPIPTGSSFAKIVWHRLPRMDSAVWVPAFAGTTLRSRLDDHVTILDMHRKRLGDIRPLRKLSAALHLDRIRPHLDPVGVEPGLAVAHVELPAVPCTAQELADARALVDAGLRRGQACDTGGLVERRALMGAAVEQCKELTIDMEHHDVPAIDLDHLVAAFGNLGGAGDDVTGH